MPQPISVTRKRSSGCASANSRKRCHAVAHDIESAHRVDAVGLALQAVALTPHRTEPLDGHGGGPGAVRAVRVRPEDEDLARLE